MYKALLLVSAILLNINFIEAQCDFSFDYVNTGLNMTIFFTPDAATSIFTELGDGEIGAFFTNDQDAYICGASAQFTGDPILLAVMADDSTTPEKDGFSSGESINWFYRTVDGGIYYLVINPVDNYTINEISNVLSATITTLDCGSNDLFSNESSIITEINESLAAWNVSIELEEGWNIFGYGCPSAIDMAEGLSNHTESIIITKDNNGNVYMPEFGFNGIGDFTPGFGYQIKLSEAISSFSLCNWYVNDIPVDDIISLQEENVQLNNTNLDYQEIISQQQDSLNYINSLIGCKDNNACNYSEIAIYHNGLCAYAQLGYDCQGNQIVTYQIGDYTQGGVVFYVDETGYHGLVVALEDVEGSFVWGCSGTNINVPYINIGDGLNNSTQILNNCFENPTAASAAETYQAENYNDWYLPSKNEFYEILFNVENLSDLNLSNGFYWSSSEINEYYAWQVEVGSITTLYRLKTNLFKVRPIRSF